MWADLFQSPFRVALPSGSRGRLAFPLLATFLAYACTGILSLKLATINHSTSPFWPASGIAVAAILLFGHRLAPAVFAGAFATNLTTGMALPGVAAIATGNTLEALLAAAVIARIMKGNSPGSYYEPLSMFLGCLAGCAAGALVGAGTLYSFGVASRAEVAYAWVTWWGGDLGGALVFGYFFTGLRLLPACIKSFTAARASELALFALATAAINWLVFVDNWPEGVYWANCLVLFLANLRIGGIAARAMLVLNCLLAIHFSLGGRVLFEFGSQNMNLLYIQGIMVCFSVSAQFLESTIQQFLPRAAIALLATGLAVIVATVSVLALKEKNLKLRQLQALVERTEASLRRNEDVYSLLLKSGASMLANHPETGHRGWRDYISRLDLAESYKAVNGVGFVSAITRAEAASFVARNRTQGRPGFEIKTLDRDFSQSYPDFFPITFVEPLEPNRQAIGLDLGSEPVRREGIELSRRRKGVTASGPIQLVQDQVKRPGFLLYFPFWVAGSAGAPRFAGWTYSPVIAEHFFSEALQPVTDALHLKVATDGTAVFAEPGYGVEKNGKSPYFVSREISLFGRTHTMLLFPKEGFFLYSTGFSLVMGMILTALLVLLATFVANISQFNSRLVSEVEKKSHELDAERAKAAHSAKLASLGEMSAGVAHEINNPLAIIMGTVPLLPKLRESPGKFSQKLEAIAKAGMRIEKIVGGLRKFSRTSNVIVRQAESVLDIVSESLVLVEAKAQKHGVEVSAQIEEGLSIFCDAVEIEQVIINLVGNSVDAVQAKEEKWVIIRAFGEGSQVVLQVLDSGTGLPRSVEGRLFEPFFTTKPVGEGTGLGLSISKGILDEHGATIALNRSSRNTCFEIRFPKAGEAKAAA